MSVEVKGLRGRVKQAGTFLYGLAVHLMKYLRMFPPTFTAGLLEGALCCLV